MGWTCGTYRGEQNYAKTQYCLENEINCIRMNVFHQLSRIHTYAWLLTETTG